ncbi:MAG: hypothetical protein QOD86_2866 [Miltoncostaeaceae bacterium]|jgi:hypothetical protein|nr:hypothetical protein [Miltoncostaeaceae bacterium]
MDPDQVLILAPEGAARTGLQEVFLRLGQRVVTRHPASADEAPAEGAVIVLDLRACHDDLSRLAQALRADARPLMVVADQPSPLLIELQNRAGGLALLTGAESDAGYRVALRICEALGARELAGASGQPLPLVG